jgi:hypothetical protein
MYPDYSVTYVPGRSDGDGRGKSFFLHNDMAATLANIEKAVSFQ